LNVYETKSGAGNGDPDRCYFLGKPLNTFTPN
jgi:hypothetical protein